MRRIYCLFRIKMTDRGLDYEMLDWYPTVGDANRMKEFLSKQDKNHVYFVRKIGVLKHGEIKG